MLKQYRNYDRWWNRQPTVRNSYTGLTCEDCGQSASEFLSDLSLELCIDCASKKGICPDCGYYYDDVNCYHERPEVWVHRFMKPMFD